MSILAISLAAAVPLHIAELHMRGGPSDHDFETAKAFSQELAERGDVLQFGGKKKGEAAGLFNRLAFTLAVMAFQPGGVHAFGEHWIAEAPDSSDDLTPFIKDIKAATASTPGVNIIKAPCPVEKYT